MRYYTLVMLVMAGLVFTSIYAQGEPPADPSGPPGQTEQMDNPKTKQHFRGEGLSGGRWSGDINQRIEFLLHLGKEKLDLTDEQVDKIRTIKLDVGKNTIRKKADKDIAGLELQETVAKDEIDFAQVKTKIKELSRIQEDIMLSGIDALEKAYNVLTPGQKEKLKSLRREFKSKRHGRFRKEKARERMKEKP